MNIRTESAEDQNAIRGVNQGAFETGAEAEIVDNLRASGDLVLSLVAEENGEVIGHIAFSKMTMVDKPEASGLVGLAPMAVAPGEQRKGVGKKLVQEGIKQLTAAGMEAIFVLGHPEYYPKFGFKPSGTTFGIKSQFDVPDEVFMALELKAQTLADLGGVVAYSKVFST